MQPATRNMVSLDELKSNILKLLAYCQSNNWSGYDPYDALNSKIFEALPFLNFRLFRLAFTQVMKRLPINLRPLLLIPKTQNPKAIALFLMAFLKLDKLGLLEDKDLIPQMIHKLIDLRSPDNLINLVGRKSQVASGQESEQKTRNPQPATCNSKLETRNPQPVTCTLHPEICSSYWCWGYSFPWQTRTILVPRSAPNLVCTTFVANALMDAYERSHDSLCLEMAVSAAEYIQNELYWEEGESVASFSYPLPGIRSETHNANFLGAALLCRAFKFCGERRYLNSALKVARYSSGRQRNDGSWDYGEHSTQRWVDNFHTGYNLCALRAISDYAEASEFDGAIQRGFEFYCNNFFREDGAPKYFHTRTFPLDSHSAAQSIITLVQFRGLKGNNDDLASSVLKWATANMWNKNGYFYYQLYPAFTSKISYMRWSQAWMLLSLATLLEDSYAIDSSRLPVSS